MLTKAEFIKSVLNDNPHFKIDKIAEAYDFCCEAHKEQKRKSGEPYAIHPIEVALEISHINMDEASVIAGLLHDVVEDTKYTKKDIEKMFSKEVANIVEGVTKFDKIPFQEKYVRQVENFRKLFLALSKDIRVLIVKLCDRVHNMRTIEYQNPEKQKNIALETITLYAPMAEQIGLQRIKNELQDRSFKILYPIEYDEIHNKVERLKKDFRSDHIIDDVINELTATMEKFHIVSRIFGREKMPYSIWKKMTKNNLQFEEISDIIAFRIIVPSVDDCYKALGAIHRTYNAIPGKFKDYISIPKSNGYRSLHTKIIGPRGHIVDIQIRTQTMHEEDEFGLASHWKYKQGLSEKEKMQYTRSSWINRVISILQESDTKNVLHDASTEIKERRVLAFTNKGKVVDLPYKSTVLDFAFAIDKKLGLYFDYAIVNGQQVGIDYIIKQGDKVAIHTGEVSHINSIWFNYTITGEARNAIVAYLTKYGDNKKN